MKFEPLKFHPILKEKIWGGNKLKTVLNKPIEESDTIGESWEISGCPGDESVVSGGDFDGMKITSLIDKDPAGFLGKKVYKKYGKEFPLLFKFLDANKDLSVQVHPNDELAQKKHGLPFGKNEMWYIIDAEKGSTLVSGFIEEMSRDKLKEKVKEGKVEEVLLKHTVKPGDVFDIPAGRVHTIGQGILLAEIQQSSDITYRIYDFNRVDKEGNKRELHLEDSYEALDYELKEQYRIHPVAQKDSEVTLVSNEYFTTTLLEVDNHYSINPKSIDSFVVLMGIEGEFIITYQDKKYELKKGESILLPAGCEEVILEPNNDVAKALKSCIL
ncbi:class I mannose-6-phosphate isomerase [Mangrovivirga sp. M17]|uniref:Phosphohexomutase n=1 Tax=Mangrovivirga halotolerans TaxID=2993936 RepID=A0ABT3RSA4_9BACT|nr:type I phosphomannose isomerase catalytic subunit [Mangrovivirga halotolerans]MCX2744510.1 class I mannose-6-phosphate isomerase [Mangrovivirga halotolerans]